MPLKLGDISPDFIAETTQGKIQFHTWIDQHQQWVLFFSHPADFTPVCTTELGVLGTLQKEFAERHVKLIGLSVDSIEHHKEWIKDVNDVGQCSLQFPIIADADRSIAKKYGMVDQASHDETNLDSAGIPLTVRSVFIIDRAKKIRMMISYPASCGRNFDEILRVIDSLQLTDKHRVTTPANWKVGEDVIIHPSVTDSEARNMFGDYRPLKPYLRLTKFENLSSKNTKR